MDRKVLPLHLACAMSPPPEVIETLLQFDKSLSTVKTPMKNYRKKISKGLPFSSAQSPNPSISLQKLDSQNQMQMFQSQKDLVKNKDYSDSVPDGSFPSLITPRTEPLSSFDASEVGSVEIPPLSDSSSQFIPKPSVPSTSSIPSNNVFFPDKKQDYALQITPSGHVRQISPTGRHFKSMQDSESPFECVGQAEEDKYSYQSNLADDFLPIHIACLFKASPAVIDLLIKAYPAGVECKNKWGMLPIHIVCANIALEPPEIAAKKAVDDFTAKRYLENLYANTISDQNDDWEIHKVVEILIDAYPQSLNISSDNVEWLTPIEYVGENFPRGHQREHLLNLLKQKRTTMKNQDDDNNNKVSGDSIGSNERNTSSGNHKTHLYTCLKMKDWESAHLQIQKCPGEASCWVKDKDYDSNSSNLPIHLACSYSAPPSIMKKVVDAYPDGVKARGKHGFNPLHISCKKPLSDEIIMDFIRMCPDSVSQKDEAGRLPLHLACISKCSLPVIKALIEAYPESSTMKDYNGHTALTYFYANPDNNDSAEDAVALLFARYDGGCDKKTDETTESIAN